MISLGPVVFFKAKWILGAIASLVFFYFVRRRILSERKQFEKFIAESLWGRAMSGVPYERAERDVRMVSIIAVLLCLALARPQWGVIEEKHQTSGLDIVVAVDVSNSMEAEDVVPTRLKKVKYVLKQMIARLAGDRVGIVAFAGSAHLQSPLTNDYDYLIEVVEGLSPSLVSNQGTDLGAALKASVDTLNRGAEQLGSAEQSNSAASRVILLVSDGEDHEEHIGATIDLLKQNAVSFFAFGVGTETGVPIPVRDPNGLRVGYKRDQRGETVMSRFHPEVLKEITTPLGGQYWTLGSGEREMESFLASLDGLSRGSRQEQKVVTRQERFQWPLGAALIVLFFFLLGGRKRRKISPAVAAALLVVTCSAQADTTLGGYLGNREAMKSIEKKDYPRAREALKQAQLSDPDSPELLFNQGSVMNLEQDAKRAAESFNGAADAFRAQNRPADAAKSSFNAGLALEKAKDMNGAIDQYLKSIDDAKRANDSTLLEKSQQALIRAAQSQPQSSSSDKKDEKSEDKKQGSDSESKPNDKSGDEKKDSSDSSENKKEQKPEGQEKGQKSGDYKGVGQKREFKSEKLDAQAAAEVLNELSRKEKELQEKMQRQKGRPQSLEKDW